MAEPISAAAAAVAQWAVKALVTAGVHSLTVAQAVYVTAYIATYVGLTAAVSMGLGALARSQMPDPESQKITRKQTRPLRYIAVGGPSRMSGAYMLREQVGNRLALVLAICEGRLARIDRIYFNDDEVTVGGDGYVVAGANGRYSHCVVLQTRLGAPVETPYSFLTTEFGAGMWPANARGDGIASLAAYCWHGSKENFAKLYPNGEIIPSIVGVPTCYDWRDPSQSRTDEATWKECWNPVVWMVHLEWFRFGRSWARCIAPVLADLTVEANYCDQPVPLKAGGTEPRYRCAGNYPINMEPAAVREALLATMDGWLSVNGKGHLVLKAGRYEAPTFTLTGDHIIGYSWRAFSPAEEAVNELTVSYVSADHAYSEVEAGVWRDESDITDLGQVKNEALQLLWCPSRAQAMRLAKRKMTRVNAPRRGQVRADIHGLNGLGRRFMRIQNPELSSMADVVVEVTNVEIDLTQGQVVFDIIQADPNIDAWDPAEEEGEQPETPEKPEPEPSDQEPARRPIARSVPYPTSATEDTITIVTFTATLPNGDVVVVPAGAVPGLTALTNYGVFWKEGAGFEVEVYPATNHMTTGSWIFIGWQATSDAGGAFPSNPTPPGGWGGSGESNVQQ
ncbi:hypothetical protein ACFPIF_00135 [Brevundimonas faecalis]|uniref:hypothetical protein n=1 Tax=Brevundimonas faecalis TaxID=947378 RepID=UPI003607A9CD